MKQLEDIAIAFLSAMVRSSSLKLHGFTLEPASINVLLAQKTTLNKLKTRPK